MGNGKRNEKKEKISPEIIIRYLEFMFMIFSSIYVFNLWLAML